VLAVAGEELEERVIVTVLSNKPLPAVTPTTWAPRTVPSQVIDLFHEVVIMDADSGTTRTP
jgi:hypothetical protein